MSDKNNIISFTRRIAIRDSHKEFHEREHALRSVITNKVEAERFAEKALRLIYDIHLCAAMCGSSIFEHHPYALVHQRLEEVIQSGLITQQFVDNWREAIVMPQDVSRTSPRSDTHISEDWMSDRPSSELDPDDDIPF